MKAINRGFFISAVISAAAVLVISNAYMDSLRPGFAVVIGLVLAGVIQVLTQHFTDTKHRPVQEIAESTVTGPATTILSGFSIGPRVDRVVDHRDRRRHHGAPSSWERRLPSGSTSSRSPAWGCSRPSA